jgi:uncharacterized protein (DUF427 family)
MKPPLACAHKIMPLAGSQDVTNCLSLPPDWKTAPCRARQRVSREPAAARGVQLGEEDAVMPTPGSDHPIRLECAKRRWRACFNDHVIADSDDALILHEAGHAPVVYFPRKDVGMEYMGRTRHHTRCPYKGEASYYTLTMDGQIAENLAWSYESPLEAVTAIASHVAFYPGRVELYAVDDAAVNPHHDGRIRELMKREEVGDVIQHTDSGDGRSQREHWPPNVDIPDSHEDGVR